MVFELIFTSQMSFFSINHQHHSNKGNKAQTITSGLASFFLHPPSQLQSVTVLGQNQFKLLSEQRCVR